MTTKKDALANGWTFHENGMMTNPASNTILESLIGAAGQLYVKRLGDQSIFNLLIYEV